MLPAKREAEFRRGLSVQQCLSVSVMPWNHRVLAVAMTVLLVLCASMPATASAAPLDGADTGDNPQPPAEPVLYELQIDGYHTNAHGEWVADKVEGGKAHPIARELISGTDKQPGKTYHLQKGIEEKGGQLRLMACATWADLESGDLTSYYESDESWRAPPQLLWTTSDPSIAIVDARGVVTAVGDGQAVITVTTPGSDATYNNAPVTCSMVIDIAGQSGAYVTRAQVIDANGDAYGTTYIQITDIAAGGVDLYVRLHYSDGTTASNLPGQADYDPEKTANCRWAVSSSEVGSINAESGRFMPAADGFCTVEVSTSGGDANKNGGWVIGTAKLSVNTGIYADGNMPAEALTVNVEYQSMPGVVGKSHTYTIDELKAIECATQTYTFFKGNTYITDTAQGIYLSTLLGLPELEVAIPDILYFSLAAKDGANPGKITRQFLFDNVRYYYPYAYFGSSQDAVPVAPMLAYADSWKVGGFCDPTPVEDLNPGTCLRLMYGAAALNDFASSYSVKYIHTLTVVLDGAPPTDWGKTDEPLTPPSPTDPEQPEPPKDGNDDDNASGDDSNGGDGDTQGPGNGNVNQDGDPNGGDGTTDDPTGGAAPAGGNEPDPVGHGESGGIIPATQLMRESAKRAAAQGETEQEAVTEVDDAETPLAETAESPWHIYEMMKRQQTEMPPIVMDNPLEPYVAPAALVALAAGAAAAFLSYRRRLALAFTAAPAPPCAPAV